MAITGNKWVITDRAVRRVVAAAGLVSALLLIGPAASVAQDAGAPSKDALKAAHAKRPRRQESVGVSGLS